MEPICVPWGGLAVLGGLILALLLGWRRTSRVVPRTVTAGEREQPMERKPAGAMDPQEVQTVSRLYQTYGLEEVLRWLLVCVEVEQAHGHDDQSESGCPSRGRQLTEGRALLQQVVQRLSARGPR
jgi:hypothetical protein